MGVHIGFWDETVYFPAEDTLLLLSSLPPGRGRMLDIGTGTGIVAIRGANMGYDVTATDTSIVALKCARKNAELNGAEIELLQSSLLDCIHGRFSLITFNPPYLPSDPPDSRYGGGKRGDELTRLFLHQARGHIEDGGMVLFVSSSLSWKEDAEGWEIREVGRMNAGFETISAMMAIPLSSLSPQRACRSAPSRQPFP